MIAILRYEADLQRSIPIRFLAGVLLGVAGCGPSDADYVEFDSFRSPDDKFHVVIEMAPENSLAYSPEAIRVYLAGQDTNERYLLATTSLANDGSRITDENIQAEWIGAETISLCLSGAEQDDEALVIDVVTASFSVESAKCAD